VLVGFQCHFGIRSHPTNRNIFQSRPWPSDFFDLSQNPSILKVPRPSSWVFTTSSTWLATSTARIEESLPTSGTLEYSTIFPKLGVSLRYSANPLFFRLARSSDSSGDETQQSTRCGLVGGIDLNTGPKLAVTRC
jgi:hypothetical protein